MLRLIVGRSGTGKSHRILKEISAMYNANPEGKYILLVPEQYSLEASDAFIEKMDNKGHMHMDVLSFTRIAHRVFLNKGKKDRVHIDDMGKTMLLNRIMAEHADELKVYGKLVGKTSFLSQLIKNISDYKKINISSDDIKINSETYDDRLLKDKLHDIAFLYEKFELQMQGVYIDEDDILNTLIDYIEEVEFLQNAYIWVDGFNGFSEHEYRILSKLLGVCTHMSMAITASSGHLKADESVFEITYKTIDRMKDIAIRQHKDCKMIYTKDMGGFNDEHMQICNWAYRVFSTPVISHTGDALDSVVVAEYVNRYDEIRGIAQKIVSLVRDEDYCWRDIAVVSNDISLYQSNIKRIFSSMNIPYFMDNKKDVLSTPLVQYILSYLRFFAFGYQLEDAVSILKTGLTSLSDEECMKLENYIIKRGVSGNRWWKTPQIVEDDKRCYCPDAVESILFELFVSQISRFKDRLQGDNTVKDICICIFEHIVQQGIYEKIQEYSQHLYSEKKWKYAHEAVAIYNGVMDVLDQLVSLIGDASMSLEEYVSLFETGVRVQKIAVIPPARDNVLIADMDRSRSHDVKAVFVIGANEGSLPKIHEDADLLSVSEKEKITGDIIATVSDVDGVYRQEQLSLYQMLCKAHKQLYISYVCHDVDGKEIKPSSYIKSFIRAGAVFKSIRRDKFYSNQYEYITTVQDTLELLIDNKRHKKNKEIEPVSNPSLFWQEVENIYRQDEQLKTIYNRLERAYSYDNKMPNMGYEWAKDFYTKTLTGGFGRFESYIKCPFAHFMSYGIRPKPRESHDIQLPDIGIVYHKVMEEFTAQIGADTNSWLSITDDKVSEMISDIVEQQSANHRNNIFSDMASYKYMISRMKRVANRSASTLVQQIRCGKFRPRSWELEFSDRRSDAFPPIWFQLNDGKYLKLTGRVDRVDSLNVGNAEYISIVDYKSGNKKWNLSDVYQGFSIQLIAYMSAILKHPERFDVGELLPAGVFYFHIDDPMIEVDHVGTNVEDKILKSLKLDGVICDEQDIIHSMDENLAEGNSSNVVPVAYKKDGHMTSASSVLSIEQFDALMKHVNEFLVNTGEKIYTGCIDVSPAHNNGRASCEYCEYKGICHFDESFDSSEYRYIKNMDDDEILEQLTNKFIVNDDNEDEV